MYIHLYIYTNVYIYIYTLRRLELEREGETGGGVASPFYDRSTLPPLQLLNLRILAVSREREGGGEGELRGRGENGS